MSADDNVSLAAAMQRWNRCIERQSTRNGLSPVADLRGAARTQRFQGSTCEGHRRDIATRFPPHLKKHVTSRLLRREQALAQGAVVSDVPTGASMNAWLGVVSVN